MLQSGIDARRRAGDRDFTLDRFEASENAAAVTFSWTARNGQRVEWAHAVIVREGRIVRMQDFSSPAGAFRAIRR